MPQGEQTETELTATPVLKFLWRKPLDGPELNLREPSGIAMGADGETLWVVSDSDRHLVPITLTGNHSPMPSFSVPGDDLEGVALDPENEHILTIVERKNAIAKYALVDGSPILSRRLDGMLGYDRVAEFFDDSPDTKGLEGICIPSRHGGVFLVKEGKPRVMLQVSYDLERIENAHELDARYGFSRPEIPDEDLDVAGICYDTSRSVFWIVSDKGSCVFLYDFVRRKVLHTLGLKFSEGGDTRAIPKVEGVAHELLNDRLFVVSDKDKHLYAYQISGSHNDTHQMD